MYLSKLINGDTSGIPKIAAGALYYQITLLGAQRCTACSGFGHKADDCPTDGKLSWLRHNDDQISLWLTQAKKAASGHYEPSRPKTYTKLAPIHASLGKRVATTRYVPVSNKR